MYRCLPEHVLTPVLAQQGATYLSVMSNMCVCVHMCVTDRSLTSRLNHGYLMAVTLSNRGRCWRQRGKGSDDKKVMAGRQRNV